MSNTTGIEPRSGRELLRATEPFTHDSRGLSWWHLGSALALVTGAVALAVQLPWWPARLLVSALAGLLMVRCFVLYHDYMHGSILQGSKVAMILFHTIGLLLLAPRAPGAGVTTTTTPMSANCATQASGPSRCCPPRCGVRRRRCSARTTAWVGTR